MSPKRIRLVAVTITPQIVVDDGENLTPASTDPIVVTAEDFATFATEKWPEMVAAMNAQLTD